MTFSEKIGASELFALLLAERGEVLVQRVRVQVSQDRLDIVPKFFLPALPLSPRLPQPAFPRLPPLLRAET